jgi:arylsulfatase A-like enzyme
MPASNILVVVVDGLRASALGAYGNTTYATPTLDRFAAESLLFDGCFAPSEQLPALYRAMWQSYHPARSLVADPSEASRSLPELLTEAGFQTTLMTDEPQLLEMQATGDFNECNLFEFSKDEASSMQADDALDTNIGRLFASVAESIVNGGGDAGRRSEYARLIWAHSRGMYGSWDAPLAFQQSLLDDETPTVTSIDAPEIKIGVGDDPDIIFSHTAAYAAQVTALDVAWQVLMEAVEAASAAQQSWHVVLIGNRGFPLGEHGLIGGTDLRLTSEQLHVPWLIRFPDGGGRLARSSTLVSHLDLLPTLLDAEGLNSSGSRRLDGLSLLQFAAGTAWMDRNIHLSANGVAVAIRTPGWCLRNRLAVGLDAHDSTTMEEVGHSEAELFVRPDDRWETNDVSKLCPEVVEELKSLTEATLRQFSGR